MSGHDDKPDGESGDENNYSEGSVDEDRRDVSYQSGRSSHQGKPSSRRQSPQRSRRSRSRSRSTSRHGSRKESRNRSRSRSRRKSRSRSDSRSRSGSYSPSYRRRRSSHSRSPTSSRRRNKGSRDHPPPSRCLGVFGLSLNTTSSHLKSFFGQYGAIDTVQVIHDAKTGRSRGFGFVYFETSEGARVARESCGEVNMNGRVIRVDYSFTHRAHTPTPGIYMGKPTYDDHYRRGRDRGYDDYHGGGYRGGGRNRSPYNSRRRRYDRSFSRSCSPRRY